ncbi:MAG: hypothetical protein ACXVCY_16595 [Pseudobdellovibrionaceae bacterium]
MKVFKKTILSAFFALLSSTSMAATSDFIGTWVNTNSSSSGIVRIVIDSSYRIRLFGACTPTPCDYGLAQMITYGPTVTSTDQNAGMAHYNFSFKMVDAVLFRRNPNMLMLDHFNRFTDNSGRKNYWMMENFRKARALEVNESFESQSGEPAN